MRSEAVIAPALVFGCSIPLVLVATATALMLGKVGYVIAIAAVPAAAAAGASLLSQRVARVAWRLALVGPVIVLLTLGGLSAAGWPLFSVDAVYWEPLAAAFILLIPVNGALVATSEESSNVARAGGKAQ
jgi:hypothetical protein